MHRLFYGIYKFVDQHKLVSIGVALAFLLGTGIVASKIQFEEDITRIIPKSERSDMTSKVLKQLNFSDKIAVIIENRAPEQTTELSDIADAFLDSLSTLSNYYTSVQGRVGQEDVEQTIDFVYQHLPLFLDSTDYSFIHRRLWPDSIKSQVAANFNSLISPSGMVTGRFIQQDPLGLTWIALQKLQKQHVGDHFILLNDYITSSDSSAIVLFISPKYSGAETAHNTLFVKGLERIRDSLNTTFQGKTDISYFGASLVAVANAKQIKSDIVTTVLTSMSVLMVLLIVFYRRLLVPVLIFIPTIFSSVFAIACLALLKPTISAISLSIGAVLIGITIDYALHILTHYKRQTSIESLFKEITKPLIMSSATNAVVFLCLLFVKSEALVDLGIFASINIFFSAVFSLIIIPHLYKPKQELERSSWIDRLARFPFDKSKVLIGVCLILIVASCFTFDKVQFNNDLSSLNYFPKALKQAELKLDTLAASAEKSVYVVSYGTSFDEAMDRHSALTTVLKEQKTTGAIVNYSGVGELVMSSATQKLKYSNWTHFWQVNRFDAVKRELITAGHPYGFKTNAHQSFYELVEKKPDRLLSFADYQLVDAMGVKEFVSHQDGLFTIAALVKMEEKQRDSFVIRIEQEPYTIVVDRKNLSETFLGQLNADFNNLINYSFIAILIILWLFFRRIELVLLSAIPIGLTALVTAGLMGIFGLEFNIFSAIVCTLVFGHGVDFSIFMTSALQKEYTDGEDGLPAYRTSILLAVLTTILAIGALVFAKHPALISISTVSLVGVFAAVIVTFVFYPILFRSFITNRARKGLSPITLRLFIFSILFFIYYGFATLFSSLIGRVVLKGLPISKQRRQDLFSKLMAKYMWSVLHLNPFVKNKFFNPYQETFDRPAVIVANHTSFLDTLTIGQYAWRIIFLVNKWVWNSPVFGKVVRAAGFYPVMDGVEESIDVLKEKIAMGYSLMVFPEGTRSYDNTVKRFHKGAFFLAERLQVDIVPMYIHGNSEVMPKGDFVVYDGTISVRIGKRIAYDDRSVGDQYGIRTKRITQLFRQEFQEFRTTLENEDYFRKKLLLSYLYKEEEIYQQVKRNLIQYSKEYYALNNVFAADETIVHWAADYGELDYLLLLQQSGRKIYSYIASEEKRQVAKLNYLRIHRHLHFTDSLGEKGSTLLVSKPLLPDAIELEKMVRFSKIVIFQNREIRFLLPKAGYVEEHSSGVITVFNKANVIG